MNASSAAAPSRLRASFSCASLICASISASSFLSSSAWLYILVAPHAPNHNIHLCSLRQMPANPLKTRRGAIALPEDCAVFDFKEHDVGVAVAARHGVGSGVCVDNTDAAACAARGLDCVRHCVLG